jgi:hypothetical protein
VAEPPSLYNMYLNKKKLIYHILLHMHSAGKILKKSVLLWEALVPGVNIKTNLKSSLWQNPLVYTICI